MTNNKSNKSNKSNNTNNTMENQNYARCEECGHDIPVANFVLHRATCHAPTLRHRRPRHDSQSAAEPHNTGATTSTTTNDDGNNETATRMIECPTCGRNIPALSATVHQAACQRRQSHLERYNNSITMDTNNSHSVAPESASASSPSSFVVLQEETNQQAQREARQPDTPPVFTTTMSTTARHATASPHTQPHDWSCPRCTLINDATRLRCEACGTTIPTQHPLAIMPFTTTQQQQQQQHHQQQGTTTTTRMEQQPSTLRVEIRQVDPQTVATATTAMSVLSWTALGALVGGPVGAAVGGLGAAVLAATQQGRNNYNNNNNSSRRNHANFTFTSTRITPQGVTTTRYVTGGGDNNNNNNNDTHGSTATTRSRTIRMQAPPGASPGDRLILQMLLLHALQQGNASDVEQMTYEQLLERFGIVGSNQQDRGATDETLQSLPCTRIDAATAAALMDKPCNICLENLQEGQDMRQLPECGHAFHRSCIDEWLRRVASCPICKRDLATATASSGTTTRASQESWTESPSD